MTLAIVVVVALLAVVVFLLAGAAVEMFEQLKQIRTYLELKDTATSISIAEARGGRATAFGLPHGLEEEERALLLILSTQCETCRLLASGIVATNLPGSLWVLVAGPYDSAVQAFAEEFGLGGPKVALDGGYVKARALGINTSPASVAFVGGRAVQAQTVPTFRQLRNQLHELSSLHSAAMREPELDDSEIEAMASIAVTEMALGGELSAK
jgi:hypothetical protein